jgi:hypothetical protein
MIRFGSCGRVPALRANGTKNHNNTLASLDSVFAAILKKDSETTLLVLIPMLLLQDARSREHVVARTADHGGQVIHINPDQPAILLEHLAAHDHGINIAPIDDRFGLVVTRLRS